MYIRGNVRRLVDLTNRRLRLNSGCSRLAKRRLNDRYNRLVRRRLNNRCSKLAKRRLNNRYNRLVRRRLNNGYSRLAERQLRIFNRLARSSVFQEIVDSTRDELFSGLESFLNLLHALYRLIFLKKDICKALYKSCVLVILGYLDSVGP